MVYPFRNPAPSWCAPDQLNGNIRLWHGCTSIEAGNILRFGVDPTRGRWETDFGQGFYTTTWKDQAAFWAWERYYLTPMPVTGPIFPVVLGFLIERELLADMQTLAFACGDHDAEGYWSLVQHCRQSVPMIRINNHKCTRFPVPIGQNWYDVVVGPVAAFWRQRVAMDDADQVSFHTLKSCQLLNDAVQRWQQSGRSSDDMVVEEVGR